MLDGEEFIDARTVLFAIDEAAGVDRPMPPARSEDEAIERAKDLPRARAHVADALRGQSGLPEPTGLPAGIEFMPWEFRPPTYSEEGATPPGYIAYFKAENVLPAPDYHAGVTIFVALSDVHAAQSQVALRELVKAKYESALMALLQFLGSRGVRFAGIGYQ